MFRIGPKARKKRSRSVVWIRGRAKGLVLVSDHVTYYLRVVLDTDFFFSCYIFSVSGPASGQIALSRNKEVGYYLNVDLFI